MSRAMRALAAAIAVMSLLACQVRSDASAPEGWVEIRGKRVAVDIADTPAKQSKGLGGRASLAWGEGMYFLYEEPAFYAFWMKGMRFPIDIVWIRDGRIIDVAPNVPFEEGGNGPTVRASELVDAVLEVPASYAAANGWGIGDRVTFERVAPSDLKAR